MRPGRVQALRGLGWSWEGGSTQGLGMGSGRRAGVRVGKGGAGRGGGEGERCKGGAWEKTTTTTKRCPGGAWDACRGVSTLEGSGGVYDEVTSVNGGVESRGRSIHVHFDELHTGRHHARGDGALEAPSAPAADCDGEREVLAGGEGAEPANSGAADAAGATHHKHAPRSGNRHAQRRQRDQREGRQKRQAHFRADEV